MGVQLPCLLAIAVLALGLGGCAQAPVSSTAPARSQSTQASPAVPPEVASGAVSSAQWARDMEDFAAQDAAHPPPRDAVLFIGSSSIRRWTTLAQDFPGTAVINRGFGGSEVRDSTYYADRIVVPYKPRMVVLYAGDNDLNSGRSVHQVVQDTFAFIARIRQDLPDVPVVYISIKPSPSRAGLLPRIGQANAQIAPARGAAEGRALRGCVHPDARRRRPAARRTVRTGHAAHEARGYALWAELLRPYVSAGPH